MTLTAKVYEWRGCGQCGAFAQNAVAEEERGRGGSLTARGWKGRAREATRNLRLRASFRIPSAARENSSWMSVSAPTYDGLVVYRNVI